jgi:hypothetical protein
VSRGVFIDLGLETYGLTREEAIAELTEQGETGLDAMTNEELDARLEAYTDIDFCLGWIKPSLLRGGK